MLPLFSLLEAKPNITVTVITNSHQPPYHQKTSHGLSLQKLLGNYNRMIILRQE